MEWIKTSERLPEKASQVIAYLKPTQDDILAVALEEGISVDLATEELEMDSVMAVLYDPENRIFFMPQTAGMEAAIFEPTHWQPLPLAPSQKE